MGETETEIHATSSRKGKREREKKKDATRETPYESVLSRSVLSRSVCARKETLAESGERVGERDGSYGEREREVPSLPGAGLKSDGGQHEGRNTYKTRESGPCVAIFMQQPRRSHKLAYTPEHHRVYTF